MQIGATKQSSKQAHNDLENYDEYIQGSKVKVREHSSPCTKFKQRGSC